MACFHQTTVKTIHQLCNESSFLHVLHSGATWRHSLCKNTLRTRLHNENILSRLLLKQNLVLKYTDLTSVYLLIQYSIFTTRSFLQVKFWKCGESINRSTSGRSYSYTDKSDMNEINNNICRCKGKWDEMASKAEIQSCHPLLILHFLHNSYIHMFNLTLSAVASVPHQSFQPQ